MESVRILPMDCRREAAGALARLARIDAGAPSGDVRAAAQHYNRKYGFPESEFGGIIEAFDYVKARLVYDTSELFTLFAPPEGLESSIRDLFFFMEHSLRGDRIQNLSMRIAFVLSDGDDTEADLARANLEHLLAGAARMPLSDEARWLLVDACVRYDDYRARIDALLDPAEALVREKAALLEPYANAAVETLTRLHGEGRLFEHFAEYGVRIDCRNVEITPSVFNFSSIGLHSNIATAAYFGEEEHAIISYGALIDRLTTCARSGRSGAEALLTLLHSLDDKRRLEILSALKTRPLYGQELAALTGLSPATVSHHMNELVSNGLVTVEKQGVKLLYRASAERLMELSDLLRQTLIN